MNDNAFEILSKLLSKDAIKALSENIIIQNSQNDYELFGEYNIIKNGVKFQITSNKSHLFKEFYNLKNAVIWTTLYKLNKISDSRRVSDLDAILEGTNFDIELLTKLLDKAKSNEERSTYMSKLVEGKSKRTLIKKELSEFEQRVKDWQNQKFNQLVS